MGVAHRERMPRSATGRVGSPAPGPSDTVSPAAIERSWATRVAIPAWRVASRSPLGASPPKRVMPARTWVKCARGRRKMAAVFAAWTIAGVRWPAAQKASCARSKAHRAAGGDSDTERLSLGERWVQRPVDEDLGVGARLSQERDQVFFAEPQARHAGVDLDVRHGAGGARPGCAGERLEVVSGGDHGRSTRPGRGRPRASRRSDQEG